MAWRNTRATWGWPAIGLHWVVAALVAGNFTLAIVMVDLLPEGAPAKFGLYQVHKSFGVTIFALAALRVAWRLLNPTPELPAGMRPWERLAAKTSHALLYGLLVAMPLTGYLMVSASPWGIPTLVFGVLPLPHAIPPDAAVEAAFKEVHHALGVLLLVLVVGHALAALKHHLWDRDTVLRRMVRSRAAPSG